MKIINENILDIPHGIITTGTNCCGVMGKGLALSIREKWPETYEFFQKQATGNDMLGQCRFLRLNPKQDPPYLTLCFAYTQVYYGQHKPYRGDCHFDYEVFPNILERLVIAGTMRSESIQVYLPWKMGAGLAGGNWDRIVELIKEAEKVHSYEFIICKL